MEKSDEIKELQEKIEYHQWLYYNEEPEITDAEFDALWDRLKLLDPENPLFTKVGKDQSGIFPKRDHILFMCSQAKVNKPEEFRKWVNKTPCKETVRQFKLDGISIESQYKNGKQTYAITRGDGTTGDDITANVKKMMGYVAEVDEKFTGATRAEIVMLHSVFEEKYAKDYANCRNLAAGISTRKDGEGCEDLSLIYYDALSTDGRITFETETDKVEWMKTQGFDVVETVLFTDPENVIQYREEVIDHIRAELEFDIDGIVIKCNAIDLEDLKRARPTTQIAFKFPTELGISTIREIDWSIKGHNYTPVAIIDPIPLAGTMVERASLSNPNKMEELNIKIGSKVLVSKRGDIIPKVEKLINSPSDATVITYPTTCEVCGTTIANEGTRMYCPNDGCPKRYYHRLSKWIDSHNIKEFGDHLLGELFNSGLVKKIGDFYKLKVSDVAKLERMGEKSATKALNNLYAVKEVTLAKFVAGFDIEGISESIMKLVAKAGFDTLDKVNQVTMSQLVAIHGIGDKKAKLIVDGMKSLYDDMVAVLDTGKITIKGASTTMGGLNGKSFCITGSLKHFKNRNEAIKFIEDNGGEFKKSVVKGLNYLVTNDTTSGSAKNKKAQTQGTKIITELELVELGKSPSKSKPAPKKPAQKTLSKFW